MQNSNNWSIFNNASVLVTGGTGSFGVAFVKMVLQKAKPKRLVVFSRDELKQYDMQHDPDIKDNPVMRYFIGDVRDRERLKMAMRGVDYVIHAAALKQVPTAEYNPFECIKTNVYGAENVVASALENGVKRVVALSTDKAVNPVNLYGASKLASDKIVVAGNNISGRSGVRFSVVRYGNVVGSRGSVIPYFKKLLSEGVKSLPITDPRMTRFLITLQDGVEFVASSLFHMCGGEIFVPKIPSVKIIDLARVMSPGVEPEVIGIRPGEKLHEVMITEDDARFTVDLGDRYVIQPSFAFWEQDEPDYIKEAKPVADDFRYDSSSNIDWFDDAGIEGILSISH